MTGIILFSTCLSFSTFSAIVRSDIPYQTFKDFAENKGQFIPGAINLKIYDKLGVLNKAPTVDFSSATINTGVLRREITLFIPLRMLLQLNM